MFEFEPQPNLRAIPANYGVGVPPEIDLTPPAERRHPSEISWSSAIGQHQERQSAGSLLSAQEQAEADAAKEGTGS